MRRTTAWPRLQDRLEKGDGEGEGEKRKKVSCRCRHSIELLGLVGLAGLDLPPTLASAARLNGRGAGAATSDHYCRP